MSEDKQRFNNTADSDKECGCGAERMPEAADKDAVKAGKSQPHSDATGQSADGGTQQSCGGAAAAGDAANAGIDSADSPAASDSETLAELEEQLQDIDPRDAEIAQLKDDLAHAQADFLNLQNEYGKYVRRAKAEAPALRAVGHVEVAQSLLSVLDDIQAARDAGDLSDGPFAAIAAKLEATLESKFTLSRFGAVGDEFDPHLHEALMSKTSDQVQVATVGQVLQPGYRIGERVLRAAKVLVLNPAE